MKRAHACQRSAVGLALGVAALAALPAGATASSAKQSVDLRFAAVAGRAPVACGQAIPGLGSTSQSAQLSDLRFYVSGVRLLRSNGSSVPVTLGKNSTYRYSRGASRVTLIDLENGAGACSAEGTPGTNASVRGTAPKGAYVGVQWTLGVPEALNHSDLPAAPAPLNLTALGWDWQLGRKFAKIEVTDPGGPTGTWAEKTFYVHLGSVGCTGDPATGAAAKCATPNRAEVRLARFNPARQKIAVDVKALLAGNNITTNLGGAPGCMSEQTDPNCGPVFRALGINWRADGSGTGRSPSGPAQRVFRGIAR